MTFVLVSVVYAVAIGEPSFGVVGPFAVGLSLFAMVFAGELETSVHSFLITQAWPSSCIHLNAKQCMFDIVIEPLMAICYGSALM